MSGLFRLSEGLQINAQLLTLLIEVAALKAQGPRNIRHVKIMPANFGQQNFFSRTLRCVA